MDWDNNQIIKYSGLEVDMYSGDERNPGREYRKD